MSEASVDPEELIHVMPEALANKIAAGEVVQRPSSAAKELIENAIDAGAGQVQLLLKAAGTELIQVVDDGCGMSPLDAALCFQRHATSKITSIDDLERIATLGFRGEALASIAAVARVELRTKRVQDEAGCCVRIEGGTMRGSEPCATHDGTSIAVRNLFYNVPARRNFLKTPATEFKHLVETFQFLALSNPRIGFTLVHDENEVYRLAGAPSADPFEALAFRVGELFGKEYEAHLLAVEETTSYLSVHGFIGAPEFHRRSRGEQFLFVNGRFVKNRYLEHAVTSGYEELLPDGAYPFFALFLTLDPRHVDVNVHPTKAEVKFDDERGVYGFLRAVSKKAIASAYLTPQVNTPEGEGDDPTVGSFGVLSGFDASPRALRMPERPAGDPPGAGAGTPSWSGGASARDHAPFVRREAPGALSERLYGGALPEEAFTDEAAPAPAPGGQTEVLAAGHADERAPQDTDLLWQLHDTYILTQIRSGLMILDQNAAHERILYEKALQYMRNGLGLTQQLLFPQTLDFSPADFELVKELMPDLRSLGFDLELFSGRSIVVQGVPADIRTGDERSILDEILEQFKTNRTALQLRSRDNLARSIARRSAIRSGSRLSIKEMRSLIDQLFMCEMPYACPSGRPTMIKIPIEELDKRFGRGA